MANSNNTLQSAISVRRDEFIVEKSTDIPVDYSGIMGVPITFMYKYCPDQFEIIGTSTDTAKLGKTVADLMKEDKEYFVHA